MMVTIEYLTKCNTGKRVNLYDLSNRNLVSDVMNNANKYIDSTIDNYSRVIDSL